MAEIHVTGLAELQKFLDELSPKIERNILRGALRAGANVIKATAKANCPIGPPNKENAKLYGGYEGSLQASIRVGTRAKGGKVTAYVKAGGKNGGKADAYYAHMVEWGTRPHVISAKPGHMLAFGGGFLHSVDHPGTKPHPFMRPALDTQAANAVVAAAEYMKARLATKEGLDTADIEIGVEV